MSTPFHSASRAAPTSSAAGIQSQTHGVQIWASLGAALLALELFFVGKWVSSDQFVPVPSGPDLPPEWMQLALNLGQGLTIALWAFCVYWFVIRQWRRQGRLTTDGLIVIACTLVSPWDPLSNSAQYWFTYNSYLVNFGSVLSALPVNLAPHEAGANEAWPILLMWAIYGCFVLVAVILCALMRAVKKWRPQTSTPTLLAICLIAGMAIDFLIEGVIYVPLGFWSFGGGHLNINAGTYYQFPILNENFFAGAIFTAVASLRYFVDDRGQTICERGIDKLKMSAAKKGLLRIAAFIGAIHLAFFITFHLPVYLLALHSTEWPDDIVSRSYFSNRVCGPHVDLACPGPRTPIARQGAPRPDLSGRFPEPAQAP